MGEDEDAIKLGEALATLRKERGLSQAEAGARIGMSSQGWGFYESGKRAGLFRPDTQRRLTSALDATPEALAMMIARATREPLTGPAGVPAFETPPLSGVEARGRHFEPEGSTARQYWRLDTDDMAPWAFSGVVLEYVPGQWPRRDQGCVVQTQTNPRLVRLYVSSDAAKVTLRDAQGVSMTLLRDQIVSLSAVTARRDDG